MRSPVLKCGILNRISKSCTWVLIQIPLKSIERVSHWFWWALDYGLQVCLSIYGSMSPQRITFFKEEKISFADIKWNWRWLPLKFPWNSLVRKKYFSVTAATATKGHFDDDAFGHSCVNGLFLRCPGELIVLGPHISKLGPHYGLYMLILAKMEIITNVC